MRDILYPVRRLHGIANETKLEWNNVKKICNEIQKLKKNTMLFVLSPTHGNLGDHAIAKAVTNLLQELKIPYKEITTKQLELLKKYRRLGIMNCYPILVNGGGNLGTLWPKVESVFRALIKANPDSKILCLPNTIFYEDSKLGRKELEISKHIYNKHESLKICAREKISFKFMENLYNDVALVPDMVLSMNESGKVTNRNGCLLCLRQDIEKTRTDNEETEIYSQAKIIFGETIQYTDMFIKKTVSIECRDMELEKKFDEFRHAKLVITDRLHGMIFCAITGTPCIVVNSKSPKVKGCYEWVKNLGYIQFASDVSEIEKIYNRISNKEFCYENQTLSIYYDQLRKYIMDMVR